MQQTLPFIRVFKRPPEHLIGQSGCLSTEYISTINFCAKFKFVLMQMSNDIMIAISSNEFYLELLRQTKLTWKLSEGLMLGTGNLGKPGPLFFEVGSLAVKDESRY